LGDHDVLDVACPADSVNIFQAFDLVFCGAVKKFMATAQDEFGDDSVSVEITPFVRVYQQMATSITVRGSFPTAELVPDTSVRPLRLTIEEDKIRENKGFRDLWDRDTEIEEISRRRQAHRLEMINGPFRTE
jgi:hypothetical protein